MVKTTEKGEMMAVIIDKQSFSKELMKLPKELLVNNLVDKTYSYYVISNLDPRRVILDMKIDFNISMQKKAIDELNNHKIYRGNDTMLFLANHEEWNKINKKIDDLYKEYESLYKQRDDLR